MKKLSTMCALVAAFAAASLFSAMAEEPSAAGRWSGTATGITGSRQTKEEFTMVLTQNGRRVTGTYSSKFEISHGAQGGREPQDLRVKGTLTGDQLLLEFGKQGRIAATVSGDSMSGSLARGNHLPLTLSATRTR
jgi:hypothetical protein